MNHREAKASAGTASRCTYPCSLLTAPSPCVACCLVPQEVVRSTGECFDARMEYHRADVSLLQRMCAAAADEFTGAADIAAALARFSADLGDRQAAVVDALEQVMSWA